MLEKLEKYANNLEDIVSQRTKELFGEKKKTDLLLYRMLPRYTIYHSKPSNTVNIYLTNTDNI